MTRRHTPLESHRMAPQRCPDCHREHDCMSNLMGRSGGPRAGALAICIDCAALNVVGADGRLRRMTPRETFDMMMSDQWPEVERAQRLTRELNEQRRGRPS